MRTWILALSLLAFSASADEGVTFVGPEGSPVVLGPPPVGQVLLLHFWATWCPSCGEDLANLQSAAAACSEKELRVFAVNVGEEAQVVTEFIAKNNVGLQSLRDPTGRMWRQLNGRGLPMNVFWSHEKQRKEVGPKTTEEWRSDLVALGCSPDAAPLSR
jgi:thiol-disulfide isomerase/thioredoxin